MRVTAALSLSLLALLVVPGQARAGSDLLIGVHDDSIKWTERPAPILGAVRALGLGGMRVTLEWRSGKRHLNRHDHNALRRAVAAHRHGVRIVLGVYGRAGDAPRLPAAREDYCRFVRNVLLRYSEVRDVVIWNEANSDTFWRPSRDAPQAYAALLARCWDVLHAFVSGVNVLTTTASSHDPAAFIRSVGEAYRASGRTLPLFDAVGHNPYPLFPGERPTARHDVYIGQGDYDRLVAVLDESFADTAQPATSIWYLENGFQTTVVDKRQAHYTGRESVTGTLSPHEQAMQLGTALRLARCQPRVAAYFNFLLADETLLEGWQSGLLWANWKRKPAFEAYRAAIADVRRGDVDCAAVLAG
ncbi:MAG TPA: hypothetical protein VNP93_12860 [Gaiellaceae bacterium]|nr:hypothetical protein [Gaiellaceae bacterium]